MLAAVKHSLSGVITDPINAGRHSVAAKVSYTTLIIVYKVYGVVFVGICAAPFGICTAMLV